MEVTILALFPFMKRKLSVPLPHSVKFHDKDVSLYGRQGRSWMGVMFLDAESRDVVMCTPLHACAVFIY